MKEKSQLKIGIVLNYLNIALGNLIPIFYTPIMLALLGQEEYGLYKLSSSVTSYLSLISLGVGSAVTRYLIKYKTEKDKDSEEKVLGLFMIFFQIIALASFLVGLFLVVNLDIWYGNSLSNNELFRMKILVFILVCNMAIGFSSTPYISVVNAHEKFLFIQCMNILSTCVAPVLNLIILYLGYASIGMAMSTLSIGIVARLIYITYVKYILKIKAQYRQMPFKLVREIFSFSIWIFIGDLVAQLYNATDTIMIGAVPALGTAGVAVYNIGATFNAIVCSMTTGVSNILTPMANRLVFSEVGNDELNNIAIRVGRIQGYIVTLIVTGFVCFGKSFIWFYAGAGYEDAYWVAICMMIPNMIPLVQSLYVSIIIAKNQHKFRSMVYLGIAVLNVIGTWYLIKILGIAGAALMTGIATLIGHGFLMNWYYKKVIGLNIKCFWNQLRKIFVISITLCVVVAASNRFFDYYNLYKMCMGIVFYTIVYCLMHWKFSMNQYEKDLILSPLKNVCGRIRGFRK